MKKQKTLRAGSHACVGVPVKADVQRNARPCAAAFTRSRMSSIMFVRLRCETLKAILLMSGGNDSD